MNTRRALAELLKAEPEWRDFFCRCCEISAFRLRAQAWQFRDELLDRGHQVELENLEDALLALARKVLPDSPAAQWDPQWAAELSRATLKRINEHHVSGNDSEEAEWIGRMNAAARANDPAAFRAAVKGWERAALEEIARAEIGGAA